MEQLTLNDCVLFAAKDEQFVSGFDRLHSANLSLRGSSLELKIDKESGRLNSDLTKFVEFVDDVVFQRLKQ